MQKLLLLASDNVFMRQIESIVFHVAASNIDKDLLHRIMACFMDGSDYDEELKIDIANAMSKGKLGVRGEEYEWFMNWLTIG